LFTNLTEKGIRNETRGGVLLEFISHQKKKKIQKGDCHKGIPVTITKRLRKETSRTPSLKTPSRTYHGAEVLRSLGENNSTGPTSPGHLWEKRGKRTLKRSSASGMRDECLQYLRWDYFPHVFLGGLRFQHERDGEEKSSVADLSIEGNKGRGAPRLTTMKMLHAWGINLSLSTGFLNRESQYAEKETHGVGIITSLVGTRNLRTRRCSGRDGISFLGHRGKEDMYENTSLVNRGAGLPRLNEENRRIPVERPQPLESLPWNLKDACSESRRSSLEKELKKSVPGPRKRKKLTPKLSVPLGHQ